VPPGRDDDRTCAVCHTLAHVVGYGIDEHLVINVELDEVFA
jgi:hypothetical protein